MRYLPDNPYKKLRLLNSFTQEELANLAQVSRLTVTLLEQGLYLNPPSSISEVLLENLDRVSPDKTISHEVALSDLIMRYRDWQRRKRYHNAVSLTLEDYGSLKTFRDYVKEVTGGSISGLSKLLVLPLRTVQSFCEGSGSGGDEYILRALSDTIGEGAAAWLISLPRR
jgi:transcriptional regulator with XRE-family HTH domain